jgi:hypothetical protein
MILTGHARMSLRSGMALPSPSGSSIRPIALSGLLT